MKTSKYIILFTSLNTLLLALVLTSLSENVVAQGPVTTRVSVASDGTQGNNASYNSAISADGRYVAFCSSANNLVSGDTNGNEDIFVYDRQTGQTTRVSVASDGTQANDKPCWYWPAVSADGRYVAFASEANNLVSGDTNGESDVFVHDRQTGQTTRVSVASGGIQANSFSMVPAISADGRYVTFYSWASNLVSGDTNGDNDIFVHDRLTGQTTRVSVASDGTQANDGSGNPTISANGRYVSFHSFANNLVIGDTNGYADVFVHDRQTGQTTRVSVASDGTQANDNSYGFFAVSADGRYVVFNSSASNLVSGDTNGVNDIFVHDRQTGQTTRVSVASDGTQGNNASYYSAVSADGRYVVFNSSASNLVSGDTNGVNDIFVHDRQTGQTTRVSVASDGTQGNNASGSPAISADGRHVGFHSSANNLVSGDTNGYADVFVRDWSLTYSISGRVADVDNNPISGITISAGGTYTVTTNIYGNYTLNGLPAGDYVVVPSKNNYTFLPTSRTVNVPLSATGQDFIGTSLQVDIEVTAIETPSQPICAGSSVDFQTYIRNNGSIESGSFNIQWNADGQIFVGGHFSIPAGVTDQHGHIWQSLTLGQHTLTFIADFINNIPESNENNNQQTITFEAVDCSSSIDLSIVSVEPVQVLEGQALVKDKATAVKVVVQKEGNGEVEDVAVLFDYDTTSYTAFYVADPSNLDSYNVLINNSAVYSLSFGVDEITKTIYFFGDSLAPTGTLFEGWATVDYPGAILESNEENNSMPTDSYLVYDMKWSDHERTKTPALQIHFFPIEWGDSSLNPFVDYYNYSNKFLQGVFPVSEQGYIHNYTNRNSDIPDKYRENSDRKLKYDSLAHYLEEQGKLEKIANPQADRLVAVVPSGWFQNWGIDIPGVFTMTKVLGLSYKELPYTVIVEAKNTARPNGPSILAHEIGHSYGLPQGLKPGCKEDYDPSCNLDIQYEEYDGKQIAIGSFSGHGLWISKDWKIPIRLPKNRKVYSFMGHEGFRPGMDYEYWAKTKDFSYLVNERKDTLSTVAQDAVSSSKVIMANGTFFITGTVTLDEWYVLPEAELSLPIPGSYSFEYQDALSNVLYQQSFNVTYLTERVPFGFTIPYIPNTNKIVVKFNGNPLAEKFVSSNIPVVQVLKPNGSEKVFGETTINWLGSDGDGDNLSYVLLFSSDNGKTWEPIDGNITDNSYQWDTSGLPSGTEYLVKIVVTDGFNTAQDVSDTAFEIQKPKIFLPIILK